MRRSPFFDGVTQSEVTIAGQPAKVPIFYYDGTATQAVFAARLGALRRLMPDPRFSPARLARVLGGPDRAVVPAHPARSGSDLESAQTSAARRGASPAGHDRDRARRRRGPLQLPEVH